jgi:hypothetical protein
MDRKYDGMICGICKGKRTVTESSGKVNICPKCRGTGKPINTSELNEDGSAKKTQSLILG